MSDVPEDAHGTGNGDGRTPIESGQEATTGDAAHPAATPTKKNNRARPEGWKPQPWTKRKPKKKVKTKRHGLAGRKWSWGYLNTFQPVEKWTKEGRLRRPLSRTTIPGCIYYAMKRIRRGSDESVHRAALADGLASITRQPTYRRVQAELRRLADWQIIKRTKTKGRQTA